MSGWIGCGGVREYNGNAPSRLFWKLCNIERERGREGVRERGSEGGRERGSE